MSCNISDFIIIFYFTPGHRVDKLDYEEFDDNQKFVIQ